MATREEILKQYADRYRELSTEYDSAEDELAKLATSIPGDDVVAMTTPTLDTIVERYVRLKIEQEKIETKRKRMDEERKTGIVCPECTGIGFVETNRTYVREGRQVIPRRDTQQCSCCAGSGRLILQEATKASSPDVMKHV